MPSPNSNPRYSKCNSTELFTILSLSLSLSVYICSMLKMTSRQAKPTKVVGRSSSHRQSYLITAVVVVAVVVTSISLPFRVHVIKTEFLASNILNSFLFGHSRLLFVYFTIKHHNFYNNVMRKCPFSIRSCDSNPQPLDRESPPITTRPGPPPSSFEVLCSALNLWLWLSCQSGRFQHQRSSVRIQSSAIFY